MTLNNQRAILLFNNVHSKNIEIDFSGLSTRTATFFFLILPPKWQTKQTNHTGVQIMGKPLIPRMSEKCICSADLSADLR